MTQISNFPFLIQISKNEFLNEKYDNLRVYIKMYMSEISKLKISDLKAQKMIILWTMKHVSAIRKHPVLGGTSIGSIGEVRLSDELGGGVEIV